MIDAPFARPDAPLAGGETRRLPAARRVSDPRGRRARGLRAAFCGLRRGAVVAALALGLALPSGAPVAALDLGAMTEAQSEAFGAAVRTYLVANPEVMIEVFEALETRRQAEAADMDRRLLEVNRDALFADPASWVGGNPDGDLTLVEFIDYRCRYCREAHGMVNALLARDGNIRFVVKEFPVLGEESVLAARFAVASLQEVGPDAYAAVHEALITLRGPVNESALRDIATAAGFDAGPVLAAMQGPAVTQVLADTHALARRMGIEGTPAFALPGRMVRGLVPLDEMERLVAVERGR